MPRPAGNPPPWTEFFIKAHKAKFRRDLKQVHPDVNPAPDAHERMIQLTKSRGRIPVIPLRIEVGFRVKFSGIWWEVLTMAGGRLWLSRKDKSRETIKVHIYQRDVEDVRCGPNFRYVMVEIF